jgi:hypothetical protein
MDFSSLKTLLNEKKQTCDDDTKNLIISRYASACTKYVDSPAKSNNLVFNLPYNDKFTIDNVNNVLFSEFKIPNDNVLMEYVDGYSYGGHPMMYGSNESKYIVTIKIN